MRGLSRFILVAAVIVVLTSCAQRVYTIGVDNPANQEDVCAGATISVKKLPDRAPFEHDAELERKIGRLLEGQGYRVTEPAVADYHLLYEYRVQGKMAEMKLELLTGAAGGMQTVRRGGPYTHVLELRVVEAPLYDDNRYAESLVWEGGAVLDDVPTNSTRFHDVVLVAAFDRLGECNLDGGQVLISLNDSDVRRLRSELEPN